jgi:hypothetical protein
VALSDASCSFSIMNKIKLIDTDVGALDRVDERLVLLGPVKLMHRLLMTCTLELELLDTFPKLDQS